MQVSNSPAKKPIQLRIIFILNALMTILPFVFYFVLTSKEISIGGLNPTLMIYTGIAYILSFVILVYCLKNKKLIGTRIVLFANILIALPASAYIGILVAIVSLILSFKSKKVLSYFTALVILISITPISEVAGQSPWLHEKNSGYIQAQAILPAYEYSSLLNGFFLQDEKATNRTVFNSDYSVYLEYGISDKLNVISVLPIKYIATGELTTNEDELPYDNLLDEGSLLGLGNYRLALKHSLGGKEAKFAVSLDTRWNTISQKLDKGLSTGVAANALGIVFHAGRGYGSHYGFASLGYFKYTNNFSDVIELNIEHGWTLNQNWNVALSLDGRFSLKNGSYSNENLSQTGLYPNNQEWLAISGKAAYNINETFGVNASLPMVPIYFKSVGFNGTIAIGGFMKF